MRLSRTIGTCAAALALVTLAGCGGERSGDAVTGDNDNGSSAAATSGTFGDLESPCGDGDASGSTDQGISDDAIKIGYGDDSGFQYAPGLNEDVGDAVAAMIDWCNDQGGINGRQIEGTHYDAKLLEAATAMQKACQNEFMLVGEGFAYDEQAEKFRVDCDLPVVPSFVVGSQASMGPNVFQPVPFPVDYYNNAGPSLLAEISPEYQASPELVSGDTPALQIAASKLATGLEEIGITPAGCGISIAQAGEASYAPFAEKLKSCGAEAVWSATGAIPSSFGFFEAIKRAGLSPQLVGEANWYGVPAARWNVSSKAADGLLVPLQVQPMENADLVPAVQQYVDLMADAGGDTSMLGSQAVSAFLLWATVAKECGSDLTRDCMVEGLSNVNEWTGGGLHAPTNPGANTPGSCALVVQLEGGEWSQVAPEERGEFTCDESYLIEIDPADAGVKLDENRISTAFTKN